MRLGYFDCPCICLHASCFFSLAGLKYSNLFVRFFIQLPFLCYREDNGLMFNQFSKRHVNSRASNGPMGYPGGHRRKSCVPATTAMPNGFANLRQQARLTSLPPSTFDQEAVDTVPMVIFVNSQTPERLIIITKLIEWIIYAGSKLCPVVSWFALLCILVQSYSS